MKKILIIGANGFVGTHLLIEFKNNNYCVFGADVTDFEEDNKFDKVFKIDILDEKNISSILNELKPDYIINLAAISSVGMSWEIPALTFDINVKGTINLLESIRKLNLNTRVLLIGSSEEYGYIDYSNSVNEECELNSINPYGISKITQERVAKIYGKAYGMDIVLTRSFNHIGVGQKKGFVVPDFASQIAEIEKSNEESTIFVGNLEAERDFTDVRDIARAYRMLLEKGKTGEVYNVGSGTTRTINSLLNFMINDSKVNIELKIDKNKYRKIETPKIQCNNEKIINDTGWHPVIPIEQSLKEILDYWRNIK